MAQVGVDASAARARPVAITVICVIGFIGIVATFFIMFSEAARALAPWYLPLLAVSAVIGLASFIGLWMMRRWGLYLYTALSAVVQAILLTGGLWQPTSLLLPAIVIGIGFYYAGKMR
jgi:hypothetical protein